MLCASVRHLQRMVALPRTTKRRSCNLAVRFLVDFLGRLGNGVEAQLPADLGFRGRGAKEDAALFRHLNYSVAP